jgi:hypothetical protein
MKDKQSLEFNKRLGSLLATCLTGSATLSLVSPVLAGGRPEYESAYCDDATVMIKAVDFYEVVYPLGWESLGIGTPQCAPCDREGDGIDFRDYHDHILASIPSNPGHGENSRLWRMIVVLPAYTEDAVHNALLTAKYAGHIPTKSEEAVQDLVSSTLPDGSPVAIEIDLQLYFICAVVNANAAP